MKLTLTTAALLLVGTAAMASNPNRACSQGNAAFCNATNPTAPTSTSPAGPASTGPTAPTSTSPAGPQGADGRDGKDGQDFDAAGSTAALASSTALAGLQLQSLSEGQTGWAAGIGGQLDGDAAIAVGLNYGLTDTVSLNVIVASTFDGNGVSAFIGASGQF